MNTENRCDTTILIGSLLKPCVYTVCENCVLKDISTCLLLTIDEQISINAEVITE